MRNPSQLKNWVQQNGDPCSQQWQGVTCSGSRVTQITLSGLGLTGNLAYNMNLLTALLYLDVSNNNLGGSDIPYNLPPNLNTLNLAQNNFTGTLPYSISLMGSLIYLNLSHNGLTSLSDMSNQLTNLTTMDLSFNKFTGPLPQSFSSLTSLMTLYLQNNQFTGSINVLQELPLTDLDIENNQFTGWIPAKLQGIKNLKTDGNQWSNNPAPPPPPFVPPPPPSPKANPSPSSKNDQGSTTNGKGSSGIGVGGIAGIVISVLVVSGVIAFFLVRKSPWKNSHGQCLDPSQHFHPLAAEKLGELRSVSVDSTASSKSGSSRGAPAILRPSISLRPPVKIDPEKILTEKESPSQVMARRISLSAIRATVYTVADLQVATNSFNQDHFVGQGSFGRVFKGEFDDGKVLAIKKINFSALPSYPSDYFIDLVADIARLSHPNLTELVGYCAQYGQCLLVYNFYRNGPLRDFLHTSKKHNILLSWNDRVNIALGAARALEYLHETCSPPVFHGDFKTANILLDSELCPHVSDYGFADLIPDHEFQASAENFGYTAPEATTSRQHSPKSDVYSFGMVMLELITGRKPFDSSRARSEQLLVRWAVPQLHDIGSLDLMVDSSLNGLYPAKSLSRFADIIALCLQPEPEFRPPMSEVVQALLRLLQSSDMSD